MDVQAIENLLKSFRASFFKRNLLASTMKGPSDFVTELDYEIEQKIKRTLLDLYPEDGFLGEEFSGEFKPRTWILDPVDGTMNYILDYHQSVISLALYQDGKIQYGWIYHPYLDEMYYAKRGEGSYLNGQPIHVREGNLSQAVITVGSAPYRREFAHATMKMIGKVFDRALDFRRSGSAAYDLACVACGRMDGFFELDLRPWDYAAGYLLVAEAGGVVTSIDGRTLSIKDHQTIVAGNPKVHEELLQILKEVLQS